MTLTVRRGCHPPTGLPAPKPHPYTSLPTSNPLSLLTSPAALRLLGPGDSWTFPGVSTQNEQREVLLRLRLKRGAVQDWRGQAGCLGSPDHLVGMTTGRGWGTGQ